jgi:hypothetical protein
VNDGFGIALPVLPSPGLAGCATGHEVTGPTSGKVCSRHDIDGDGGTRPRLTLKGSGVPEASERRVPGRQPDAPIHPPERRPPAVDRRPGRG